MPLSGTSISKNHHSAAMETSWRTWHPAASCESLVTHPPWLAFKYLGRIQVSALALLVDFYIYGIYSLLCAYTLFILFRKIKGNLTNKCLIGATLVMYLVSTASVALNTVEYLQFLALDPVDNSNPYSILDNFAYSIPAIHFIFGDAIVVWRVWVIWIHRWRIVAGHLFLLFCTSAVVLAQLALIVATALSCVRGDPQAACIGTDRGKLWDFLPVQLYYASLVLTLLTNGVATALIAYRAWIHHRSSQAVHIRIGRDRALAVLLLLVESGALYCTFWLSMVIVWPFTTTQQHALYRFINLLPQLTGMYPTVIIVICALRRSYADTVMSVPENLTVMQFAPYRQPACSASTPATLLPRCRGKDMSGGLEVPRDGCGSSSSMHASKASVDVVLEAAETA
ncbi:hypothetical protein FA95DRAFT_116964 [Auriscalpium vulgare]|uniref:Uncharacterized protein n=1 Tax=Auriscalpium vulgare TaxID=40419 RepID=A0ACB8RN91_9AGAM|nr:hypothetical protein FA95DRAFT_116964 [Auriscalpium vulgare]